MTVDRWDQRQLCADGSCIGVIGPDGTCKMCGRAAPNWGDERKRGLVDEPDEAGEPTEEPAAEKRPLVAVSRPGKPAEWNTRQLCSDGGCIGVIGDDGKCKLCGKPAGNVEESEDDYEDDDDLDASADGDEDDDEYEDDDDDDDEYEDDDEPDDAAASGSKPAVASASEPAKSAAPLGALEIEDEANRKLCPDGACVGVIGADGKCKICGKDAA